MNFFLHVWIIFFALFASCAQIASAADGTMKLGMVQTSVLARGRSSPVIISGAAMSLGFAIDMTPALGFEGAIQPLVDFKTQEISRNSVNGTLSWNVVGSSRKYSTQSDLGTLVYHGGSAFSLLLRGGVQYYQQYLEEVGSSLKGSTINTMIGMAYRSDLNENQAIGIEALTTMFSFSNSVEGLSSKELEIALFYRRTL